MVVKATVFAFVGVAYLAHWALTNPSPDPTPSQSEWSSVLAFSGVILLLTFAVPLVARVSGGRLAFRASLIVAAGAGVASVANIVEDGLHVSWFFFVFILGTGIMQLGLLALTIALARRDGFRFLAAVPAGVIAGIDFYADAGGPIMLATWLGAAALALALPSDRTALAAR